MLMISQQTTNKHPIHCSWHINKPQINTRFIIADTETCTSRIKFIVEDVRWKEKRKEAEWTGMAEIKKIKHVSWWQRSNHAKLCSDRLRVWKRESFDTQAQQKGLWYVCRQYRTERFIGHPRRHVHVDSLRALQRFSVTTIPTTAFRDPPPPKTNTKTQTDTQTDTDRHRQTHGHRQTHRHTHR